MLSALAVVVALEGVAIIILGLSFLHHLRKGHQ